MLKTLGYLEGTRLCMVVTIFLEMQRLLQRAMRRVKAWHIIHAVQLSCVTIHLMASI